MEGLDLKGDHTETVEIQYDPQQTNYEKLLSIFWKSHDATQCHKRQYMSAIFYHDEEQRNLAEMTKEKQQQILLRPIVTKILPAEVFYSAEDYHQKYMLRHHKELLDSLGLSGRALVSSHVAARLNGYLSEYGSLEAFENEWKKLGLTEEQADYVRQEITRQSRFRSH